MTQNPLEEDETQRQRIRERAYSLWEADGRPDGQEVEYWERASSLVGMEESAGAGQLPVKEDQPEEASIQENLGEFPDRLSDQGERAPAPAKANRTAA